MLEGRTIYISERDCELTEDSAVANLGEDQAMMTGGISRRVPIPGLLYRVMFPTDMALSRYFPWLCASFFTLIMTRR